MAPAIISLALAENSSMSMTTRSFLNEPEPSLLAANMIEDRIGYIKVNKFGRNTYEEFYTEMLMLDRAGAGRA